MENKNKENILTDEEMDKVSGGAFVLADVPEKKEETEITVLPNQNQNESRR